MYIRKSRAIRGRVFCALFATLLLPGCGGYFSGQWPNLAEGFEDAAERDAALVAVGQLAEGQPGDDKETATAPAPQESDRDALLTRGSGGPPEAAASAEARETPASPASPAFPVSPETVATLTVELEQATGAIAEARQAYEAAKASFGDGARDGARDRAKRRWLTAQLKLTGLSRAADGLNPVLEQLRPAARDCHADDDAAVCELTRRAGDAADALAAYLLEERRFLTAQDPAGRF